MSGNVLFSRWSPWLTAALIGSGLLWLTKVSAKPANELPDYEGESRSKVIAPIHPTPVTASDSSPAKHSPHGSGSSPPNPIVPLEAAVSLYTQRQQNLLERVRTQGHLPVIVRLQTDTAPPGATVGDSETRQQDLIAAAQTRVIERLLLATGASRDRLAIKTFSLTPALGLQIDERELIELLAYPEVLDVVEDAAAPPLDR